MSAPGFRVDVDAHAGVVHVEASGAYTPAQAVKLALRILAGAEPLVTIDNRPRP